MILFLILFPFAGAALVKLVARLAKPYREACVVSLCLIQLIAAALVLASALTGREMRLCLNDLCGMRAGFRADGFRSLYACVAAFMWFCTSLMSKRYFAHYHHQTRSHHRVHLL